MTPVKPTTVGILVGAVVGSVTVGVVAHAATPTAWTGGSLATANVPVTGCDTATDTIDGMRTRYHAATERYEISRVDISSVTNACKLPYRVTIADAVSDGAALTDGVATGTLGAGTNAVTFAAGSGPRFPALNDSNSQARVVVIVRGP